MGLAPYGEPIYKDKILKELLDLKADGSFRLDMRYFGYCNDDVMTSQAMAALLDGPPRKAENADHPARDGSRGVDPGGDGGDRHAHRDVRAEGHRVEAPRDGRWSRAQLRRQRQGAA